MQFGEKQGVCAMDNVTQGPSQTIVTGNVVPVMRMQERFRPRRVKIHLKCRTTFHVPVPRSRRPGNLVTMSQTSKHRIFRFSL
jgi:hypothetical protein